MHRHWVARCIGLVIFAYTLMGNPPVMALPNVVIQEGFLETEAGLPLDGNFRLEVRLYSVARRGQPIFEEIHPRVTVSGGFYAIAIGSIEALPRYFGVMNHLGLTINDWPEMTPRTP